MNLLEAIRQVQDSSNFKNWFGKSILHTSGVPHTFYHGTSSDIPAFSHVHTGKGNDSYGSGFYFTNKPDVASSYATDTTKSPNVIPVHLRVTKPIRTDDEKPFSVSHISKIITSAPNHKESLSNFGDIDYEGYHKVLNSAVEQYRDIPKHQAIHSLANDFYNRSHKEFLENLTKHTGYDSVIHTEGDHTIVNVFHPNQIKSALGNSGNYSKKSNSITEGSK